MHLNCLRAGNSSLCSLYHQKKENKQIRLLTPVHSRFKRRVKSVADYRKSALANSSSSASVLSAMNTLHFKSLQIRKYVCC